MKKKYPWITALCIFIISLTIGACFHGYRIHPENVENYNLGVTMGITMASVAGVALVAFIILFALYKHNKKSN